MHAINNLVENIIECIILNLYDMGKPKIEETQQQNAINDNI